MHVRLTEKMECSKKERIKIKLLSLVTAVVLISLLIAVLQYPVFGIYKQMMIGAFGSLYSIRYVLVKTVPLALCAIGVTYAYRMKFWNIGAEGQVMMGAFAATGIALFYNQLPKPLVLLLMALAAIFMGAVWILLPAIFKIKLGVNETILTLMLNYVATQWITYLQYSRWKDPKAFGFTKIATFEDSATLPELFGIHIGFYIMLLILIATYVLFKYTKLGFKMKIIGESSDTANYLGFKKNRILFGMVALSGAICGLVGMIQISGVEHTLHTSVSNNVGFSAILIAWLSGLNPVAILVVSFLFAGLTEGAGYLQTVFQIPQDIAIIIQGIVLFCVTGSEFFTRYSVSIDRSRKGEMAK